MCPLYVIIDYVIGDIFVYATAFAQAQHTNEQFALSGNLLVFVFQKCFALTAPEGQN